MRPAARGHPNPRPFRPPPWPSERYHPRPPHHHQQQQQRPQFTVLLFRPSHAARRAFALPDVEALVNSCHSPPFRFTLHSSGALAAKLLYLRWSDALDAALFIWRRRLAGAHPLRPVIEPAPGAPPFDKSQEERHIKALFSAHIHGMLDCDGLQRCRKGIDRVAADIKKLSSQLKRPNSLAVVGELRDKRKQMEVEQELLKGRMEEFRAALDCILERINEGQDDMDHKKEAGKDGEAKVFKFQGALDWDRIHNLLERERRRLEEGLPLYAYRRQLVSHVSNNQVMVLIGETGSGKSTQLAQFLADSGLAADGAIICTQPRKIAAISLAQRVGEESTGCYPNNFVLSYPSYSFSQELGSRVIFMTDHCLLQHYTNDASLPGISCILVDEAHERSLNTDILLALIKKKLLDRPDLRLIIMSATVDASKLAEYFYGCCTFHVMGRNFPVEIKYVPDVSSFSPFTSVPKGVSGSYTSYVSDVLKMANIIHKTEKDGAILAFLTSQMEVEWACENFTDPSAIVLPMHGKLSFEEQIRVFQDHTGKRKVIFATNIAETSLTIKGVKYVIDSGMMKESRFEPSSGMNVLKVCRISQGSASQRAGRAGRTESGKCYRLYSKCDFHSMKIHQDPEICKVHLGVAMLRILALSIRNIHDFEFIDAPCENAIDVAINNLIHLGAVIKRANGYELTDTGRNLLKLGIEPRLGKIILDCVGLGLRKEGLVLAAVMANSSSIFCRVGSDEDKYKADRLRVPFCHHDGDLFTLLSVYKKWESEHVKKNEWCWQNSINAKTMRRCQDTVLELENCLEHDLNIIVPSYWLWDPDESSGYHQSLKRVILSCLVENVAMYSGCDQLGYEVALTGQSVQLHPSSSLLVYGRKPDWVVFGEILSLPNEYLVCVTAVDYNLLLSIQTPLFNISDLERRKLQMYVIKGVGNTLLRRFCGKQSQNLQRIVSRIRRVCSDDRATLDFDFDKNEIYVYACEKYMEKASLIANEVIEYEMKSLRDECQEKYLYLARPGSSPLALFGSGAEIKHLELEKRYLSIEIFHPNAHALCDKELLSMVDRCVSGIANFQKYAGNGPEGPDANKWGRIMFLSPETAQNAVTILNEVEFDGSMLKAVPVKTGDLKMLPFHAIRAKVSWPRRPSMGKAFVYCNAGDAEFIVRDCFALAIGGKYINCQVSKQHLEHQDGLYVSGLPKDVSESELYDAFVGLTKRRILGVRLLRGEVVNTPTIATCEETLVKEISQFMPKRHFPDYSFRVEVYSPGEKDTMIRANITFDGSLHLEAAKALDHIEGKILPGFLIWQKIQCQRVFHSSVSFPFAIYDAVNGQLSTLLEDFKCQRGVSYCLEKSDYGSYRVKISANATKPIADLRRPLELLLKGNILSHSSLTPDVLQLLLSKDGITLMKDVGRETGTYIMYDRRNLNVRVFGSQKEVFAAEEKLVCSLLSLQEKKQLEIHLRGRLLPSNLMKELVQRFGPDLKGLKEEVAGVEVMLNTRRHVLYVRGNKEVKQKVKELISEVVQSVDRDGIIDRPLEFSCPICLCELEDPYKLEACGHECCRTCLVGQCESAIRSHDGFPLRCVNETCKKPIWLVDLKSLLSNDKLEELFRASFSSFVTSSGGLYRFCPSPDCPSVYRVAAPDEEVGPFVCGFCLVETCTKCHLEYHPFLSCERYKEYKEDPDLSLVEWRMGRNNVKTCPCGFTIEKFEGCDHVCCRCGRHMCWLCMEFFESDSACYSHIRSVHGS